MAAGRIERATRAELRHLKVSLTTSAMGQTAVELARRLDRLGGANDHSAVELSRELRLLMSKLAGPDEERPPTGGVSDVERFLASIAAPDGGNTPAGS